MLCAAPRATIMKSSILRLQFPLFKLTLSQKPTAFYHPPKPKVGYFKMHWWFQELKASSPLRSQAGQDVESSEPPPPGRPAGAQLPWRAFPDSPPRRCSSDKFRPTTSLPLVQPGPSGRSGSALALSISVTRVCLSPKRMAFEQRRSHSLGDNPVPISAMSESPPKKQPRLDEAPDNVQETSHPSHQPHPVAPGFNGKIGSPTSPSSRRLKEAHLWVTCLR
jgi:hypothetical protein